MPASSLRRAVLSRSSVVCCTLQVASSMDDANERAKLLQQTTDGLTAVTGEAGQPDSRNYDSLKRYIQEVREISRETGSAKVVEWISVPCAVASTVAPLLVVTMERSLQRRKFFRVLLGLTGIETFAGFGVPPMIVLWSLYANENETVISRDTVLYTGTIQYVDHMASGSATLHMSVCRIIVTICLVLAAAAHLHMRQGKAGEAGDFPLVQKEAFLVAACELASAFVFVVLGVYKWLIAQAITSLSLRADAITCFATVYLNILAGVAHLCDAVSFTRAETITPAGKERVQYFEYFSLAAAVFLLGAAVYHLRVAVHIPRPI